MSPIHASELTGRAWLNTGDRRLTLDSLRGKVVLLDFWTFCCVNCLHVIDELRPLEEKYADSLVVIGVHSPKFEYEADPQALAANVQRYGVDHPVLDDPGLTTWQSYGARAWPTLVLIDPEGCVERTFSGEGHAHALDSLIGDLVARHDAKGTLRRDGGFTVLPEEKDTTLKFPGGGAALPDGRLAIADAGHDRVTILEADGSTLSQVIDGPFREPQGLALVPAELRDELGYDLVVASTGDHRLVGVGLDGHATILAGTGAQRSPSEPFPGSGRPGPGSAPAEADGGRGDGLRADEAQGDGFRGESARADGARGDGVRGDSGAHALIDPLDVALSTPWDVEFASRTGEFLIAMAGLHQIWAYEPRRRGLRVVAGTTQEGLVDGDVEDSWWAQTSALTEADDGRVWAVDSETSSVRHLDLSGRTVTTLVGTGLFDFGHVDGPVGTALFQHPLGIAVRGTDLLVADTYNGAVRIIDTARGIVRTLARDLAEPTGIIVTAAGVWVIESAAHRLVRLTRTGIEDADDVDDGARATQRPVTEVAPGRLRLRVPFAVPRGEKLDDAFGPSTQLMVSSTPSGLLAEGSGTGTELERTLTIAADHAGTEAILHISARAASCDDDTTQEFPACHLHAQDWGVPVRVVPGAPGDLTLPLNG